MTFTPTEPAIVARARHLVENTTLSQVAIARELGIARTTLFRWIVQHGWTRPPGAPACTGPRFPADSAGEADAEDLAGLIAQCLRLLKRQVSLLGRSGGAARTRALRAVAETTRTLKELSRIAATLGGPDPIGGPDRAAPEVSADDLDDARFAALCDDLAEHFVRWQERRGVPLLAGGADAPGGAGA